MKRILFFETTIFTGATRVTRTIAKKISGRFEVRTAIISDIKKPRKEIEESIERERPDILFSSFSMINPDVILDGKEKNLIVVIRSDYNFKDLSIETQERILETYTKADWIIAQTPEMKDDLLSKDALKGCRIKVIENPLDEEDILLKTLEPNPFPDNGCFHFLWVGREDPIKDLPTLHKAFDIVHKQNPNTDLTLISNDSNPYHWIKNADCLVISSISEASPNVLREALFLGTSVISTDCSPTVRKHLSPDRIVGVGKEEALAHAMVSIIREKRETIYSEL
ncbi:MAG: glycosyltransferase [Prevotella sp.]|nr:glycosyltransferase [Prevotella sp.]